MSKSNVLLFTPVDFDRDEALINQDVVDSLCRTLTGGGFSLKSLPVFIEENFTRRTWEHYRATSMGTIFKPMPFHEFVKTPSPAGLGSSIATIRALLASAEGKAAAERARNLIDKELARGAGGANNPNRDAETGRLISNPLNLYSIQGEATEPQSAPPIASGQADQVRTVADAQDRSAEPLAPTGTSMDAGLRRLRKAAKAGDSKAQQHLDSVLSGAVSTHKACVEMGWRKPTVTVRDDPGALAEAAMRRSTPLETLMHIWLQTNEKDRAAFLEWARARVV